MVSLFCVWVIAIQSIPDHLCVDSDALAQPSLTRQEFAAAIRTIRSGLTGDDVRQILGEPDDIWSQADPGAVHAANTREIWCYGTNGHLTLPTLGQVHIDYEGRVRYTSGSRGRPPDPSLFEESYLRVILRKIDLTPGGLTAPREFNPRQIIEIVNLLHAMAPGRALAAIEEYLRVQECPIFDAPLGPVLIMRALFKVPEDPNELPRIHVPGTDALRREFPLYPLVIQDDIPLYVVEIQGIMFARTGPVADCREHLAYYRAQGRIRPMPLRPPNDPLRALSRLTMSPRWVFKESGLARRQIMRELLALVPTVFQPTIGSRFLDEIAESDLEIEWQEYVDAFSKLGVSWNEHENSYVFADGTKLQEQTDIALSRYIWQPSVPGRQVNLTVQRLDGKTVLLQFYARAGSVAEQIPSSTFRVFRVASPLDTVAEFHLAGQALPMTLSQKRRIELPIGETIQIEMIADGEVRARSPVLEP